MKANNYCILWVLLLFSVTNLWAQNKDGRLQMNLEYTFEKDGKKYAVKEILVRRQDPANDLRFEEW